MGRPFLSTTWSTSSPDVDSEAHHPLAPYFPRLVIDWITTEPDARHREEIGTVAFVDISGFTKLSEGLALNKQDLAATSDPPVGAALEASICDRPGLRLFEHVPVLGDRYKQSGDFSHG